MIRGLLIAAPASGSGKTVITLGLLRALHRRGFSVAGAKSGPDYIDPRFHQAVTGRESVNLDAWAMTKDRLRMLSTASDAELLIVEGAMGLFDGAPPDGAGSAADLADALGVPVVLVVDAARQGQSVAALVRGFSTHRPGSPVAGVILNRVGSARHETLLRRALSETPVLGCVPRNEAFALSSRHLGLIQAVETPDLAAKADAIADIIDHHVELDRLVSLAQELRPPSDLPGPAIRPLGQRIAVAWDTAFRFVYAHVLQDWRDAGASISFFSPLLDECPAPDADAVYFPGGYPELHAERLSQANRLRTDLQNGASDRLIYGECGGYMVLGRGLIDAEGKRHDMMGLLPLETSFATRRLTLGYRRVSGGPGDRLPTIAMAHEFHYASTIKAEGSPLFQAHDAEGTDLGSVGLRHGHVMGSFIHMICENPDTNTA